MGELLPVNDTRLYVEMHCPTEGLWGARPAVILLHHGLGATPSWRHTISALIGAGYRVLVYDRRGYGRSAPVEALGIPDFLPDQADLLGILDYYGVRRAALVGHSDGGTLGLYFAASHPERVACLAVVAAHIYVESGMEAGIRSVRREFEKDPVFRAGLQRIHGEQFEAVFNRWYFGWLQPEHLTWDMRPALGGITCPVLVVQGLLDEHATPRHAEDLAAASSDARLWLVEGARHMFPQEQPELFNSQLVAFLRSCYVQ